MSLPVPAEQTHLTHPKYRADIDGLRAIAVLAVVGFHAFPFWVQGGFIGVDIFFVISGFLISSIIFENLRRETFSFIEFYSRRIKRIFPALIVVLTASFVIGWFVLLSDEFKQLGKHIAGGAGFIENFLLWGESGYFDNASETKPLLHLWTLAIEEQFYIVWPLVLWFSWKKRLNLLTIAIAVAVISFALNIGKVHGDAVAAFYSPQTRFWELMAGSILAHIRLYKPKITVAWLSEVVADKASDENLTTLHNLQSLLGAALIVAGILIIKEQLAFPGWWAVLPTLGAVFIISAGPHAWLNREILSRKILVWFGLISYPLYLWHWPLLSFARIVESDIPSREIRIAAVVLSVVLAWFTYMLVERPLRLGKHSKGKVIVLVVLMTIVGYVGYRSIMSNNDLEKSQAKIAALLHEARNKCDQRFPEWTTVTDNACLFQKSSGNSIAIIGDSHAGHLFFGLSELLAPADGVAVFPASCAAPYINVSTATKNVKARKVREGAYKLINSAYDYIIKDSAIKVVVLAHNPICSFGDAVDVENLDNKDYREVLKQGMRKTFSALIKADKKVVVLFDNPEFPYEPKLCVKRPFTLTEKNIPCFFPRKQFDEMPAYVGYRSLVESVLKDYPQVRTLDLSEPLCDKESCYISKNGHLLYSDRSHLNFDGSRYVAPYLLNSIRMIK